MTIDQTTAGTFVGTVVCPRCPQTEAESFIAIMKAYTREEVQDFLTRVLNTHVLETHQIERSS